MSNVCILPVFRPNDTGGVARHVLAISRHLTKRGWNVIANPGRADIVHCHAMERYPQVDVYTNHGIYPLKPNMPGWQQATNRDIFANIRESRKVVAVSKWTADQWGPLTGRSPTIIPNGIDLDEWRDVPKGFWRPKLGATDGRPIVLWGKTGLSEVLDPTPLIALALRRSDLLFVAPLDPNLLMLRPANVKLVGPQAFPQMQALLADCDVYLATVQENHAIQVLEAMALGKPILGYNWGGTAETITSGVEGRLVQPGNLDALAEALEDVLNEWQFYGEAGRETVAARFQWSGITEKLEGVYMESLREEAREASPGYPVCSIIIPVYNKEGYIAEAIESAINQKQAPTYEVVVIDDGSTDDSLAVARRTAKGHPNVTVLMQDNQGVAAARNNAIKVSRGKYIACLDADDRIEPLFLNRLSSALTSDPGLGLVYSDFMAFGPERPTSPITCAEYDFESLKAGNMLPCCNLFRRKAWKAAGGYKNINPSWEDYELWLNMGKLGWYGKRVPGTLFWYRKVPKQGRDFESQGQAWKLRATVNRYHRDLYNPLVSFIIPCYKQAEFLPDAINSALAQTFKDIEVIVVDDGNEPKGAALIRDIVETYHPEDVRLVVNAQNMGLASTRNAGVEAAKGTWFVPLDADDKVEPTFLEECMRATALHPKKFAYTDSLLWWPEQNDKTEQIMALEYDFDELLRKISWSCTILCPVDAWRQAGGYKPTMSDAGGWEDWEFAVALGELGVCGERVAKPLFWYRQHSAEQMRYKAEQNKPELRETLRRLHAGTYRGERGPMCCGGRRGINRANGNGADIGQKAPANPPAPEGEGTLVRYVGSSMGSQQWRGPSGKSYKFGLTEPLQKVRAIDLAYFRGRNEFQIVEA